ncbi:MAG: DUF554 family protein [Verrucomicrobiales bacterium]|nr:DUF554 family protein [Verrucomicrobiales bacterium]
MEIVGTIINGVGILAGGIAGLSMRGTLSAGRQETCKTVLGLATIGAGLHLTWTHLNGGFWSVLKQFTIVMIAMSLGRLVGRLLRLQRGSNRLGQLASETMEKVSRTRTFSFGDGFIACTILFCVAPLSILGAVEEALTASWWSYLIKAGVDALAAMAFVGIFGRGVLLVIVPVVAWQGSLTLGLRVLQPWLLQQGLVDSVLATTGLLLFSVALLIFQVRKVAVADYLPSLALAPLISWFWR